MSDQKESLLLGSESGMSPKPSRNTDEYREVGEEQVTELDGPDFELDLTILDHATNNVFPRSGFALKRPQGQDDMERTIRVLAGAYQRLINKIPWLASEVRPLERPIKTILSRSLSDLVAKVPLLSGCFHKSPRPQPVYSIHKGVAHFTVVRRTSPSLRYADMQHEDFHAGFFPRAAPMTRNGVVCNAGSGLKVVFTDDHHLLVSFAIHHALADGCAHMRIAELFTQQIRLEEAGALQDLRALHGAMDRSAIDVLTPPGPLVTSQLPPHPALKVWGLSRAALILFQFWKRATFPRPQQMLIFRLDMAAISELKYKHGLKECSTHDLACAIIWRGIMGARMRAGLISPNALVSFAGAANMRRALDVPTYLGNAVTTTSATIAVSQLTGPNGIPMAAMAIRRAVQTVTLANARSALEMCVAAPDLALVNLRLLARPLDNAVLVTSWFAFDPWQWEWGREVGALSGMHLPTDAVRHVSVILPRNSDGSMTVALHEDAALSFWEDAEWSRYASAAKIES